MKPDMRLRNTCDKEIMDRALKNEKAGNTAPR